MSESKDTAAQVFDLFNEGQAAAMALGVAELLNYADAEECPPEVAKKVGWAISALLRAEEIQRYAEFDVKMAERTAERRSSKPTAVNE
jgi:hypothetical protein